jgi:hypothetical protein
LRYGDRPECPVHSAPVESHDATIRLDAAPSRRLETAEKMSVEINWEPRGVYRSFRGHVTSRDALESFKKIAGDHRFDALRYNLLDFTQVESWHTTDEELREIGAYTLGPALSNPQIHLLMVTADDSLRAMTRRYIAQGISPYPHELFTELAAARRWIEDNFPMPERAACA